MKAVRTHGRGGPEQLFFEEAPVPVVRPGDVLVRVRKLDLHEDAIFRYCGSADAIMGFEYAESARPIPIFADRCLRVDEPPPTAGH